MKLQQRHQSEQPTQQIVQRKQTMLQTMTTKKRKIHLQPMTIPIPITMAVIPHPDQTIMQIDQIRELL